MSEPVADIALIGLAVMGQNLILNMNDNGFVVCAYNRTTQKVDDFLNNEAKDTKIVGAHSLKEMVQKLKKPRRVMMLVKAGPAVDSFIEQLIPLLEPGDIIIDGGNSEYKDTQRRCKYLKEKNLLFIGAGVSGGEEGARYGPSIMPGGHSEAWKHVKDIFQKISAKANGEPCCDWVGEDGAGHFVKMVHNGIEYGDMQLCCEAYDIMRKSLNLDHDEMSKVFEQWNKTELDSFLIEITADILKYKENNKSLVTKIRDSAGQKGTGKWTAISAIELGVPVTLIGESVFSRCLSSLGEREKISKQLSGLKETSYSGDKKGFIENIRQALYASKIISYAQGFMLFRKAAKKYNWNLDYGKIALMWRGGCIIRSVFLGDIKKAFDKNKDLENLLLDDFFKKAITKCENSLRLIVSNAAKLGIPTPAFSTALHFYDGYRSAKLPTNLIQTQKDYSGTLTQQQSLEKPENYFKMVHNGIEYGDMQLCCEAYDIMRQILDLDHNEMNNVFEQWNKTELDSSLIEKMANILKYKQSNEPLVALDDSNSQKSSGELTAISALDLGVPVTLISESVFSLYLSLLKSEREKSSKLLSGPKQTKYTGNKEEFVENIRQALYASKIISCTQCFMLLREATKKYNWNLNLNCSEIASMCCVKKIFDKNLESLLLDDFYKNAVKKCENSLRLITSNAAQHGVSIPAFSAALAFYDGYRSAKLPANLIQAQRDYFGAHTYELLDKPGVWIHTNWTGKGGNVSSSTYNA